MRVMVVGSGAREHAVAFAIANSPQVDRVFCAPGNAGTASVAENVQVKAEDVEALVEAAKRLAIDLAVVGPEAPLVAGLVDALQAAGIHAFGPSKQAARIEGSKVFAKRFMAEFAIPTAAFEVFEDPDKAADYIRSQSRPLVVKADGLAAGKGVIVTSDAEGALAALDRIMRKREFGEAGDRVVVEDLLVGEEISYHIVCDGERFIPLAASQDHKRISEGDSGPNTGGMGAYSPPPLVTPELEQTILERVVRPTVDGLRSARMPYVGALYFGLMIVDGEPLVLEYNARFGDPEAQVLLTRFRGDFAGLLMKAATGDMADVQPQWEAPASICVVLASEGYPGSYAKGREIRGIDQALEMEGVQVFHAGTKTQDGRLVTSGGRVLSVTACGQDIDSAAQMAYRAVSKISFQGMQFRRDIGWRARSRW